MDNPTLSGMSFSKALSADMADTTSKCLLQKMYNCDDPSTGHWEWNTSAISVTPNTDLTIKNCSFRFLHFGIVTEENANCDVYNSIFMYNNCRYKFKRFKF